MRQSVRTDRMIGSWRMTVELVQVQNQQLRIWEPTVYIAFSFTAGRNQVAELFAIPALNLLSCGATRLLSSVHLSTIRWPTKSERMIWCCKSVGEEIDWIGADNEDIIQRGASLEVNSATASVRLGSGWRWRILQRSASNLELHHSRRRRETIDEVFPNSQCLIYSKFEEGVNIHMIHCI